MTTTGIIIAGFYDRGNLGDELYKRAIPKVFGFEDELYRFVSVDDWYESDHNEQAKSCTLIICGGGDIVNPYFMNKLRVVLPKYSCPKYALSVGVPYDRDVIYLSMFDLVCVRSMRDYNLIRAGLNIGSGRLFYIPDAVFSLPMPCVTAVKKLAATVDVGLCLAQPVMMHGNMYDMMVSALLEFERRVPDMHVVFWLLPYNTSSHKTESDLCLNRYMCQALSDRGADVRNIVDADVQMYMCRMDFVVCMRYHAFVMALGANRPFFALYTTRKMDNLITDVVPEESVRALCSRRLKVDQNDVPVGNDAMEICDALHTAFVNKVTVTPPRPDPDTLAACCRAVQHRMRHRDLEQCKASWRAMRERYLRSPDLLPDHESFSRTIVYSVTSDVSSDYIWGVLEKVDGFCGSGGRTLSEYDATNDIEWIYNDCDKKLVVSCEYHGLRRGSITFDPCNDDTLTRAHRAGWNYVVTALKRGLQSTSPIMIDTFSDRTFHWGRAVLRFDAKLPYRQPWIGFLHHTFETSQGPNNCTNLVDPALRPEFWDSLPACKAIIVLSRQAKREIQRHIVDVPVFVVHHPTEFVDNVFTMDKFFANASERRLIQIGAWLRDSFAIYDLDISPNPLGFRKTALRGRGMSQYFVDSDSFDVVRKKLEEAMAQAFGGHSRFLMQSIVDSLDSKLRSVEVLSGVDNETYDELLSKNVVFLRLVDVSACNTVCECIVRNTPLIINRHPALEEYLGEEYPGFYSDLVQAAKIFNDVDQIKRIHEYLASTDKRAMLAETFVASVQKIVNTVTSAE